MSKTIICTVCPNGCEVTVEHIGGDELKFSGNKCKRGIEYCTNEFFNPMRTFTSSVRIDGAKRRMLPVRTTGPVPKDLLMECADEVHNISVSAPVKSQQIIKSNILNTGVDLIAAMTLDRED